jgi:urease accessory protein
LDARFTKTAGLKAVAAKQRAVGRLRLSAVAEEGQNRIGVLEQAGCGRFLFPARRPETPLEAVIVNTGGGLTGGDKFDTHILASASAALDVTTQACEKVYQSDGAMTRVKTRLDIRAGATLRWLPQETILFDSAAITRSLEINMEAGAELLAVEAQLLGRQAMGETLANARYRDSWRIRREGRLIFADETTADGNWRIIFGQKAALGEKTAALATVVHVSERADAMLDDIRGILNHPDIDGGASAFDGMLVMRMVAASGFDLRKVLLPALERLSGRALPRVWHV